MLVPLPVVELVAVTDKLIDDVVESVPLSEPVRDDDAPLVIDEVGVLEIDLEREVVELGVVLEVDVADDVPLPVDVPLVLIVEDLEIESVPLCVLDELAPRVGEEDLVFAMLVEILIVLANVAIAVGE